jgi:hypothetical protein
MLGQFQLKSSHWVFGRVQQPSHDTHKLSFHRKLQLSLIKSKSYCQQIFTQATELQSNWKGTWTSRLLLEYLQSAYPSPLISPVVRALLNKGNSMLVKFYPKVGALVSCLNPIWYSFESSDISKINRHTACRTTSSHCNCEGMLVSMSKKILYCRRRDRCWNLLLLLHTKGFEWFGLWTNPKSRWSSRDAVRWCGRAESKIDEHVTQTSDWVGICTYNHCDELWVHLYLKYEMYSLSPMKSPSKSPVSIEHPKLTDAFEASQT